MPWAWKIHYKEDGKPITETVRGKEVPAGIVDWMDTKGYIHHTLVPIYVKGEKKGMPKNSVHGCFTKRFGWKLNAFDEDDANYQRLNNQRRVRANYKVNYAIKSQLSHDEIEKIRKSEFHKVKKMAMKDRQKYYEDIAKKGKKLSHAKNSVIYTDAFQEGGTGKLKIGRLDHMPKAGLKRKRIANSERLVLNNRELGGTGRSVHHPNAKIDDFFKPVAKKAPRKKVSSLPEAAA